MRRPIIFSVIIVAVLLLRSVADGVRAQVTVPRPENPPMASVSSDRNKETLYAIFSENKKGPSFEQQRRAYGAAKEYVNLYGADNDTYSKEARRFVTNFEKEIRQDELYAAYTAKKYAKTFELGRPLLKTEQNFYVLSVMAEAGYDNSLTGNASLSEETIGYLRSAIQLLETGKVSKPDPCKSLEAASGFLNLALGWFLKDKSPPEAATAFAKAVQPRSPYENDALTYYRLGVAILKGEFAQLSAEYNDKFGAKLSSPEQQAMFARINHLGLRAIDAYARAIALSDPKRSTVSAGNLQFTPEFRDKVQAQLTALYKSFHNDSDAGLNELIAGVLSKPIP